MTVEEIKVFTLPNCPKCPAAKKIAKAVAEEFKIKFTEVDVGSGEGQIEGLMHQIMSTPSIAIDNEVISRGEIVPKKQFEEEVRKRLSS
jgi:glutaredoxin